MLPMCQRAQIEAGAHRHVILSHATEIVGEESSRGKLFNPPPPPPPPRSRRPTTNMASVQITDLPLRQPGPWEGRRPLLPAPPSHPPPPPGRPPAASGSASAASAHAAVCGGRISYLCMSWRDSESIERHGQGPCTAELRLPGHSMPAMKRKQATWPRSSLGNKQKQPVSCHFTLTMFVLPSFSSFPMKSSKGQKGKMRCCQRPYISSSLCRSATWWYGQGQGHAGVEPKSVCMPREVIRLLAFRELAGMHQLRHASFSFPFKTWGAWPFAAF